MCIRNALSNKFTTGKKLFVGSQLVKHSTKLKNDEGVVSAAVAQHRLAVWRALPLERDWY